MPSTSCPNSNNWTPAQLLTQPASQELLQQEVDSPRCSLASIICVLERFSGVCAELFRRHRAKQWKHNRFSTMLSYLARLTAQMNLHLINMDKVRTLLLTAVGRELFPALMTGAEAAASSEP